MSRRRSSIWSFFDSFIRSGISSRLAITVSSSGTTARGMMWSLRKARRPCTALSSRWRSCRVSSRRRPCIQTAELLGDVEVAQQRVLGGVLVTCKRNRSVEHLDTLLALLPGDGQPVCGLLHAGVSRMSWSKGGLSIALGQLAIWKLDCGLEPAEFWVDLRTQHETFNSVLFRCIAGTGNRLPDWERGL